MSAPPPPPSYNESQGHGGYQPSYGATGSPPPGMYAPPPHGAVPPPQSGMPPPYPPPQGAPYPPHGGPPYPPQYAPVGQVDPSKGYSVPPSYQQHPQTNTSVIVQPQQPVIVGTCPACRIGVLEDDFTCCGVLCAILFFPFGILCCLAMRQRRCASCGSVFG